jgi:hypothetical protein
MQNKKLYIVLGLVVMVVAAAAFVAGRLLNAQAGPLGGMFPIGNGGWAGSAAFSISMTPAPEIPTGQADVTGVLVKRDDNTLTLQSMGGAGVMVSSSGEGGVVSFSPADGNTDAPTFEVVVTGETKIWRDATQFNGPPSDGGETFIQQVVEEGSLDDLNNQTMIMVWGRKNGDRIIAEVISYSNPVMFSRP